MIICSCNALSDRQVASVLAGPHPRRPTVSQVYSGLGCRAKCGGCAPTIKRLRDQAPSCGAARRAEAELAA
jgi:bacterioferritin-associated ferredoxin